MNIKKNLENRIRGWFPKEPNLPTQTSPIQRRSENKTSHFNYTTASIIILIIAVIALIFLVYLSSINFISPLTFEVLVFIIIVINYFVQRKRRRTQKFWFLPSSKIRETQCWQTIPNISNPEKKFCGYCGTENTIDANFCQKCGKKSET